MKNTDSNFKGCTNSLAFHLDGDHTRICLSLPPVYNSCNKTKNCSTSSCNQVSGREKTTISDIPCEVYIGELGSAERFGQKNNLMWNCPRPWGHCQNNTSSMGE